MQSLSWKDVLHYGAALGLIVLGVLGEMGVPGIDAKVCFFTAAGILGAGLKGGWVSGSGTKFVFAALVFAFTASLAFPVRAQTPAPVLPQVQQVLSQIQNALNGFLNTAEGLVKTDLDLAIADANANGNTVAATCWQTIEQTAIKPVPQGAGIAYFKQVYLDLSSNYVKINQNCSTVAPLYVKAFNQFILQAQALNL